MAERAKDLTMEFSGDELAGIVDQFGALTPCELRRGIREAAFRDGADLDEGTIEDWIEGALADFSLLTVEEGGSPLVVPGPRAFPEVPAAASDLPHVLDVETRTVSDATLETGVRNRLAAETAKIEDSDRVHDLIDVTYDAEAWAGIDLGDVRERLAGLGEQES